jgi:hypothetical protein
MSDTSFDFSSYDREILLRDYKGLPTYPHAIINVVEYADHEVMANPDEPGSGYLHPGHVILFNKSSI